MTRQNDDETLPLNNAGKPIVAFDYETYAPYLEDTELSEDQKRELLEALWLVICEFVALGFEVHPIQQARDTCGKLPNNPTNHPFEFVDAVDCEEQSLNHDFRNAAPGDARMAAERIPK